MCSAARDVTQWVEAAVTAGKGKIEICTPDANSVSAYGAAVVSKPGTVFVSTVGDKQYFLAVVSTGVTPPGGNNVVVKVIVHFEPQPA